MRDLKTLPRPRLMKDIQKHLDRGFTIFEKIEYSGISRTQLREKLDDLRNRQVPRRDVLLDKEDEVVVFYWFKNWLHPNLRNFFFRPRLMNNGIRVPENERENYYLRCQAYFYENNQQNYSYSLQDIEDYINQKKGT